ncbi:MAG: hypothetical protein IPI39_06635 [Candidatus Obscuribacter sp.]|nr:hypothetical protein [Candidatus Obscuribacter sp.]MBK7837580.1 hypothetical protein [Candidatus Obscuribacter sp.]
MLNLIPPQSAATKAQETKYSLESQMRLHSRRNLFKSILCASVASSALADWLLILYLGSITVFTGPDYSGTGLGSPLLFVPVYIFMVATGALSDLIKARLGARLSLVNLDLAKVARLIFALSFLLPQLRTYYVANPNNVVAIICLLMLASHWSMLHLVRALGAQGLKTSLVALLIASWGLGQALALKLSPAFTIQYVGDWPVIASLLFYLIATISAVKAKAVIATTPGVIVATTSTTTKPDFYPHGLMVGLMSLPAMCLLICTSLFAIQGLQIGQSGSISLTLTNVACKLTVAFAIGALMAPLIEHRIEQRKLWLLASLLCLSLFAAGALAKDSALSYFSIFTATALTGSLATIEESRFLQNLAPRTLGLTISLRNAHVLLLSGLIAIPIERSIPLVSSLYFLKELNVQSVVIASVSLAIAPIVIVLGSRWKKKIYDQGVS